MCSCNTQSATAWTIIYAVCGIVSFSQPLSSPNTAAHTISNEPWTLTNIKTSDSSHTLISNSSWYACWFRKTNDRMVNLGAFYTQWDNILHMHHPFHWESFVGITMFIKKNEEILACKSDLCCGSERASWPQNTNKCDKIPIISKSCVKQITLYSVPFLLYFGINTNRFNPFCKFENIWIILHDKNDERES